ncbi:MAG: potassium channel family protein, partial [Verrucomicrobiales bacterium]|nr:potassium channel family protein [Verrucomicrobiales bacterium]
ALLVLTLWLLAGLSAAVWIWALFYLWLGVFDSLEASVYFSTVAFTTLGFGDITLGQDWRLASACMAANGLILFSLNTAFLIEVIRRLLPQKATGEPVHPLNGDLLLRLHFRPSPLPLCYRNRGKRLQEKKAGKLAMKFSS